MVEYTEKEYDPALHITAGDLRAVGIVLPDKIPDCGWIPKADYLSAISRMTTDVQTISEKERTFNVTHSLQLPPFFWVEIHGTMKV